MENYANLVALAMLHTAREKQYLGNEKFIAVEALADPEKDMVVAMLRQIRIHLARDRRTELTGEEMISLFTFVLAKAAEGVSNVAGGKPYEMELVGMLDGKIPFYTDPKLEAFCHSTTFPEDFATAFRTFCDHYGEALHREGVEPVLILGEALKWTWRIAVHVCCKLLTGQNG